METLTKLKRIECRELTPEEDISLSDAVWAFEVKMATESHQARTEMDETMENARLLMQNNPGTIPHLCGGQR